MIYKPLSEAAETQITECFSDSVETDFLFNILGIKHIFDQTGSYYNRTWISFFNNSMDTVMLGVPFSMTCYMIFRAKSVALASSSNSWLARLIVAITSSFAFLTISPASVPI